MEAMIAEIDQQMLLLPVWVQWWMNWMVSIFFVGAIFAWWKKTARWALLAMLATMPTVLGIYHISADIHLFGIAHFIFWGPLAVIIWKSDFREGIFPIKGYYHAWLILLFSTIAISLAFDLRDITLVLLGNK